MKVMKHVMQSFIARDKVTVQIRLHRQDPSLCSVALTLWHTSVEMSS